MEKKLELQTRYLKIFLKSSKNGRHFLNLAKDFLEDQDNNSLSNPVRLFDDNDTFNQCTPFCSSIKTIIRRFENDCMEERRPFLREWLWQQRKEEIFFFKCYCNDVVKKQIGDEHLISFARLVNNNADWATLSVYNRLINDLKAAIFDLDSGHLGSGLVSSHSYDDTNQPLHDQLDTLRKEIDELNKEKKQMTEILTDQSDRINLMQNQIIQKDKMIEEKTVAFTSKEEEVKKLTEEKLGLMQEIKNLRSEFNETMQNQMSALKSELETKFSQSTPRISLDTPTVRDANNSTPRTNAFFQ